MCSWETLNKVSPWISVALTSLLMFNRLGVFVVSFDIIFVSPFSTWKRDHFTGIH